MRALLAPLTVALLALGATACGASSKPANTTAATGLIFDRDDRPVRFYGHEAGAAERQAITALVRSYYAAGAKEDGLTACRLIHSLIAESVPEDYAEQASLRGKTCATVMSKLFKQLHRRHQPESATPRESATLRVIGVRAAGGIALVLLRFGDMPEPEHIAVHLEGRTWKIWELFGNHMP